MGRGRGEERRTGGEEEREEERRGEERIDRMRDDTREERIALVLTPLPLPSHQERSS
jgi:hypothetical protein